MQKDISRMDILTELARDYIRAAKIEFDPYMLARAFSGLNFKRYDILKLIPKGKSGIVIIQRCSEPDNLHYCVQYGGSGRYFTTWDEVRAYYDSRWGDHELDGWTGKEESLGSRLGRRMISA